jgi:hypothetical protein
MPIKTGTRSQPSKESGGKGSCVFQRPRFLPSFWLAIMMCRPLLPGIMAYLDLQTRDLGQLYDEMATEVGWDAARKRLYQLLEKADFEYENGGKSE